MSTWPSAVAHGGVAQSIAAIWSAVRCTTSASRATSKYGTRVELDLADPEPRDLDHATVCQSARISGLHKTAPVPGRVAEPTPVPTIADYALLGNCQGSALVSRDRLDRLGVPPELRLPRVLRPHPRRARRLLVDPSDDATARRCRALSTSRTRWCSSRGSTPATGASTLTDFMPLHPDDRHNDIGKHSRPGARAGSSTASTARSSSTSRSRSARSSGSPRRW